MVEKLPALHFYVQDYLADTRSLTNELKGFYVDLLCYMHKSSRRGYLQQPSGSRYSPEQLGKMTGCSADDASRLLRDLINLEVISATHQEIPFSRRMVRDEKKRVLCKKAGLLGGNPTLKGKDKGGGYAISEDENEDAISSSSGGGSGGGSRRKHAFQKSPFYPYEKFRAALSDWPEEKTQFYFDAATGYSDANGGRYLNWVRAVQNWDKKQPWEKNNGQKNGGSRGLGFSGGNGGGFESARQRYDRKIREGAARIGGAAGTAAGGDLQTLHVGAEGTPGGGHPGGGSASSNP